jgi:hypothetical protein
MKKLIFRNGLRLLLLAGFLKSLTLWAQQMPDISGVNAAVIRLFGENPAFTAQADVRVLNSNRVEWFRMPSVFASADTKLRLDVDMKLIRSALIQPDMLNRIKQVGMDRVTSVVRPDKKVKYIIFPGAQSFTTMSLATEDTLVGTEKVEKKPLGRETLDGHACVKNLSTVKSSKGSVLLQATTWNATDLKDFPIQIEMKEGGNTTIMHFQNVNLNKPDAKLFEIPAGYKDTNAQDKKPPVAKPPVTTKKK